MHFVFYFIERDFFGWGGFHIFLLPLLCVFCAVKVVTLAFFFREKKDEILCVVSKSLSPYNNTFTYTVVRFARGRRRRQKI